MRPVGQARRASISGIFEPARRWSQRRQTGCSAGRMYRYIELRTLGTGHCRQTKEQTVILRCVVVTLSLVLGLAVGPSTHTVLAQNVTEVRSAAQEFSSADIEGFRVVTTRDIREGRISERSVIEGPSINGGAMVPSAVEDQEISIGTETVRRTRREFVTDTNGRSSVVSTLEEHRTVRADGSERIVRDFTEPDVNGRDRATRREREDTVAKDNGVFVTQIEVSEPSTRGNGFVATERVEQRERRDGAQVLEFDRTTYINPTGGGAWVAQERRVLTRDYSGDAVRSIESVYTADDAGTLVQSERIVSREWTGPGGHVQPRYPRRGSRRDPSARSAGRDREDGQIGWPLVDDTYCPRASKRPDARGRTSGRTSQSRRSWRNRDRAGDPAGGRERSASDGDCEPDS